MTQKELISYKVNKLQNVRDPSVMISFVASLASDLLGTLQLIANEMSDDSAKRLVDLARIQAATQANLDLLKTLDVKTLK